MGVPRLWFRAMIRRWRWEGSETGNLPWAPQPGIEDTPGEHCYVCVYACTCMCMCVYVCVSTTSGVVWLSLKLGCVRTKPAEERGPFLPNFSSCWWEMVLGELSSTCFLGSQGASAEFHGCTWQVITKPPEQTRIALTRERDWGALISHQQEMTQSSHHLSSHLISSHHQRDSELRSSELSLL